MKLNNDDFGKIGWKKCVTFTNEKCIQHIQHIVKLIEAQTVLPPIIKCT